METNIIHLENCLTGLAKLPDNSIDCCVTSPPYFGLRDYGMDEQIGLEETPELFVSNLVAVFRQVKRALKDEGTLWVNIGDSYVGTGTGSGTTKSGLQGGKLNQIIAGNRPTKKAQGEFKNKDLIGIPWMIAFALRADGWYLRQDIIWHKPNPMPESVTDRCTKSHEYVFLLSKSPKYYYNNEAIKEKAIAGNNGSEFHTGKTAKYQLDRASKKPRAAGNKTHKYVTAYEGSDNEEHRTKAGLLKVSDVAYDTRNKRSVWTVASKPFADAHFATFPEELIKPCILAGCPVGGIVLDPFMGAGTTALVARSNGRDFIGYEINPEYKAIAERRLKSKLGMFAY